jgi:hypothetical protein
MGAIKNHFYIPLFIFYYFTFLVELQGIECRRFGLHPDHVAKRHASGPEKPIELIKPIERLKRIEPTKQMNMKRKSRDKSRLL